MADLAIPKNIGVGLLITFRIPPDGEAEIVMGFEKLKETVKKGRYGWLFIPKDLECVYARQDHSTRDFVRRVSALRSTQH